MPSFDIVYVGFHAATMDSTMDSTSDYGIIMDAAMAVKDGHVSWIGPASELPSHTSAMANLVNLGGAGLHQD